MIKFAFIILCCLAMQSVAGVSVVGTRFVIEPGLNRLNIKLINDNESDYLVKTTIADNENDKFVITPPLFILPKNDANLVTIIPNNLPHSDTDQLYSLTITTIPKSQVNNNHNTVSLAVRSHFHLIYRHKPLNDSDFNALQLQQNANGQFYLKNSSHFIFTVQIMTDSQDKQGITKTILPDHQLAMNSYCKGGRRCYLRIAFVRDDGSTTKPITISNG